MCEGERDAAGLQHFFLRALTWHFSSVDAGVLAGHWGEAEGVQVQRKTRWGLCNVFQNAALQLSLLGFSKDDGLLEFTPRRDLSHL